MEREREGGSGGGGRDHNKCSFEKRAPTTITRTITRKKRGEEELMHILLYFHRQRRACLSCVCMVVWCAWCFCLLLHHPLCLPPRSTFLSAQNGNAMLSMLKSRFSFFFGAYVLFAKKATTTRGMCSEIVAFGSVHGPSGGPIRLFC